MHTPPRRRLIAVGAPCAWLVAVSLGASLGAAPATAQPRHRISLATLQAEVAGRFPLRFPIAGLLNLDLQAPALQLLPAQNRLQSLITITAAGPALRNRYTGQLDLDFALRYAPEDRSIRAHQIRFNALTLPGLRAELSAQIAAFGPAIAEQALGEVVLHQLSPQDLALPDTMGLRPDTITVTDEGLVIGFVAKTS